MSHVKSANRHQIVIKVPRLRGRSRLLGIVGIVVLTLMGAMFASSALKYSNQQSSDLGAYQTLCKVGTLNSIYTPAIFEMYGTPTLTPSFTPLAAAASITPRATATEYEAMQTMVAVLSSPQPATQNNAQTASIRATDTPLPRNSGSADRGKTLFFSAVGGCSACHDTQAGRVGVGPSLQHIASATRNIDVPIDDYLRESIISPNAYIVKGYSPGVMPPNYERTLTQFQIEDLVAYMKTLR